MLRSAAKVDDNHLDMDNSGGKAGRKYQNKFPFVDAVTVDKKGQPVHAIFTAIHGVASAAIENWARSTLNIERQAPTSGLPFFNRKVNTGCSCAMIGGARKSRNLPQLPVTADQHNAEQT